MGSQKLFWADNLRFLRHRLRKSQDELARNLGMTRAKLNAHENAVSKNPPLDDLIKIADHFHIAIDTLLKVDLSKIGEVRLRELEAGNDVYISGGKIRVLSITVSQDNKEQVEFVPKKAKAGYMTGYNDPEYIAQLPRFSLPHLSGSRTYRIFPTEGDSMRPFPEGCMVVAEYVADWNSLNNTPGIVVLRSEQTFLFKMVTLLSESKSLLLHSLNSEYPDREVWAGDVLEVWKYHSHITNEMPTANDNLLQLLHYVKELKEDMKELKRDSVRSENEK